MCGGTSFGGALPARLASNSASTGHLGEDRCFAARVVELGVVDVIDRLADQFLGPHFVHNPVHAGPGAAESFGDKIHGIPRGFGVVSVGIVLALGKINLFLGGRGQRASRYGEQGSVRVSAVEVLDRVPHRLRAATEFSRDLLAHFRERPTNVSQFACQLQNPVLLRVGQVAEPRTLLDEYLVFGNELLDCDSGETRVGCGRSPSPAEPIRPFTRHREIVFVETLNRLLTSSSVSIGSTVCSIGSGRDRALDAADEQRQVVPQVVAADQQVRVRVRAVIGDAEADVLVRVRFARLDLAQKLLGAGDLGLPAQPGRTGSVARSVPSGLSS